MCFVSIYCFVCLFICLFVGFSRACCQSAIQYTHKSHTLPFNRVGVLLSLSLYLSLAFLVCGGMMRLALLSLPILFRHKCIRTQLSLLIFIDYHSLLLFNVQPMNLLLKFSRLWRRQQHKRFFGKSYHSVWVAFVVPYPLNLYCKRGLNETLFVSNVPTPPPSPSTSSLMSLCCHFTLTLIRWRYILIRMCVSVGIHRFVLWWVGKMEQIPLRFFGVLLICNLIYLMPFFKDNYRLLHANFQTIRSFHRM